MNGVKMSPDAVRVNCGNYGGEGNKPQPERDVRQVYFRAVAPGGSARFPAAC